MAKMYLFQYDSFTAIAKISREEKYKTFVIKIIHPSW